MVAAVAVTFFADPAPLSEAVDLLAPSPEVVDLLAPPLEAVDSLAPPTEVFTSLAPPLEVADSLPALTVTVVWAGPAVVTVFVV